MATLERNFYEGTPRQWELFDFDEVPYGTMHEGIPQKWELFGTEQPDFFEDQNIDTSKQVQDILENNEQTTFQPIDSVQQDTRQKVNSICSGVQEFPMEAFPMTIEGIHITYLHRAENIGEKEATINFRHDNKELYFLVTFERKNYRDRQDGSPYTLAENIKLKRRIVKGGTWCEMLKVGAENILSLNLPNKSPTKFWTTDDSYHVFKICKKPKFRI